MSATSLCGSGSPSNRENDAVREDPTIPSTSDDDSARVSLADDGKPAVKTMFSDYVNESRVLKLEDMDSAMRDASEGDNQTSSLISTGQHTYLKKTDAGSAKPEHKKVNSSSEDYDSILSEFDQFASKGASEAVGYGYEIGDMVWGKVKSHPCWPGHIYNEAFALPSVQRSKREGYVLVAFFGDSSYGWFDPSELVPFEENFLAKSQQTFSRTFLKAVEEALDEVSRRRRLGLVCRCRNKFNFCPSSVNGYFVADVGDNEPVAYSMNQISKARESFHPNEMLNFVQQLALTPMSHQHWTIEFVKNKATVLACRKALFEEFDETYAQAFGTAVVRPSRPTAPVVVDPSKALLSGRLVFAEALGKRKLSVKPAKSRDQLEKEKYLFKRRDEPIHTKTKKASPAQVGGPALPLLLAASGLSGVPSDSAIKGHMHLGLVSDISDGQHQPVNQASLISDIKPSQGSMKLVRVEKVKLQKLSAENATLVAKKKRKKEITAENVIPVDKTKKRKKEIRSEAGGHMAKLSFTNSDRGTAVEKVSEMLFDVPLSAANSQLDDQKNNDLVASSSSLEAKQAVDLGKVELPELVTDLRALAIDPSYGVERSCHATVQLVFLKYRSLVYQKSLVSSPQTELERSEALHCPVEEAKERSTMKPLKSLLRPADPTKGGKKRFPSDHLEPTKKKKKLDDSGAINKRKKLDEINKRKRLGDINNRKKAVGTEDVKLKKKKILDDSKPSSVEKSPQRSSESPNVIKVESSKRMDQPGKTRTPTMLVMKFPAGASLPSGAHLRAKFARFGTLDYAATRVFWKTYTCRLVFLQKVDAEEALRVACESGDFFGNTKVRYYIREVEVEPSESVPIKAQKEDTSAMAPQSRETAVEQRTPVKIAVQPHEQQLKSCLKKPHGEEVGNGNGRGTSRVKFVLGGEESISKTENEVSSYNEGASSYAHSMDVTGSKNLPDFDPHAFIALLPSTNHFQKLPIKLPRSLNATLRNREIPGVPNNDISQQFLNLLNRCSDVVNDLTGVLGYAPYHPL